MSSLLREDAGGVAELVFSLLYNPWRAIVQLIGSLIILAFVDWRLLLGSLVLIPAVEVAVACAAVDVALTLVVEVIVFMARAWQHEV